MTMPEETFRDLMIRSKTNLELVEEALAQREKEGIDVKRWGPFEFTQLLNSLLCTVALPRERDLRDMLAPYSMIEAINRWNFPVITDEYPGHPVHVHKTNGRVFVVKPITLDDFVRLLRNSFLHGNISLEGEPGREIEAIRFWNEFENRKTWGGTLTVEELRQLVDSFVDLATELYELKTTKQSSRVA